MQPRAITRRGVAVLAAATTLALSPGHALADDDTTIPGDVTVYAGPEREDPEIPLELGGGFAVEAAEDGTVYLTSVGTLYRISPDGDVEVMADVDDEKPHGDGGPIQDAGFDSIGSIALGPDEQLYVADSRAGHVRVVDADDTVDTVAGGGDTTPDADGTPAAESELGVLGFITVDHDGAVYIADRSHYAVWRLDDDGNIAAFAGNGEFPAVADDDTPALDTAIGRPEGVAVHDDTVYISVRIGEGDGSGLIFDTTSAILAVDADNTVTTHAEGRNCPDAENPPPDDARFCITQGLDVDDNGHLYAADSYTDSVHAITPDGAVTTLDADFTWPISTTHTPNGDILVVEQNSFDGSGDRRILRFTPHDEPPPDGPPNDEPLQAQSNALATIWHTLPTWAGWALTAAGTLFIAAMAAVYRHRQRSRPDTETDSR